MRRPHLWLVPLLLLVPAVRAADEPSARPQSEPAATPAQQFQQLLGEVKKAQRDVVKAYGEAKTEADQQKVQAEFYKQVRDRFAGRFLELARKYPKDEVAFQALGFVASIPGGGTPTDQAQAILLKNYLNDDRLGQLCQTLADERLHEGEELCRAVLAKSSHRPNQARALLGLAQLLKARSEAIETRPAQAEKASKEAEDLFAQAARKFADNEEVSKQAKASLDELRHFGIGKQAPDIVGEDAGGKKFKLSDYRGKVVVLDFWASW